MNVKEMYKGTSGGGAFEPGTFPLPRSWFLSILRLKRINILAIRELLRVRLSTYSSNHLKTFIFFQNFLDFVVPPVLPDVVYLIHHKLFSLLSRVSPIENR